MKNKINVVVCLLIFFVVIALCYVYRYQLSDRFFRVFSAEETSLVKESIDILLTGNEARIRNISTKDASILSKDIYPILRKVGGITDSDDIVIKCIRRGNENNIDNLYATGFFADPAAIFRIRFVNGNQTGWRVKLFTLDEHYFYKKISKD